MVFKAVVSFLHNFNLSINLMLQTRVQNTFKKHKMTLSVSSGRFHKSICPYFCTARSHSKLDFSNIVANPSLEPLDEEEIMCSPPLS